MMKNIKINLLISFVSLLCIFFAGNFVVAGLNSWGSNVESAAKGTQYETNIGESSAAVAKYVGVLTAWTTMLGITIMIQIVLAGYEWMTAAGNDEKAGTAIKRIQYALIGVIILISMYAFASYLIDRFTEASSYNSSGAPAEQAQ